MSRFLLCLLVSVVVAAGCSRAKPVVEEAEVPVVPGIEVGDFLVGEPIRHANLTIFPVRSRVLKDADRYITLNEGLEAGTVEIVEVGSAAENSEDQPAQPDPAPQVNLPLNLPSDANPFDDIPPPNPQRDVNPFGDPVIAPSDDQAAANDDPFDENPDGGFVQQNHDPIERPELPAANTWQLAVNQSRSQGQGGGAEVNRLMVINTSGKPLYLMPGEVIVGGQQDRTIGDEIVIQPTGKPVPIEAFCVEHGRWESRTANAYATLVQTSTMNAQRGASVALAKGVNAKNAAEEASRGKFIGSVGNLSNSSRLAVQFGGNQSLVWREVAKDNDGSGVKSSSGAFTGNYSEEQAVARLDPYIEQLHRPIAECRQIVGVIVAINGEVQSMDVFESTPLFQKLWPKLLKSYALDAANAADPKLDVLLCPTATACAFLHEATEGEAKTDVKGDIVMTRRSTKNLESFSAAPNDAALGGGALGGGVHTSAFAK